MQSQCIDLPESIVSVVDSDGVGQLARLWLAYFCEVGVLELVQPGERNSGKASVYQLIAGNRHKSC